MANTSTAHPVADSLDKRRSARRGTLRLVPLSVFRIVVGLLFVCHGTADLFGWPASAHAAAPVVGSWPDWYAAIIEFVAGGLVLLGLGTRVCALLCSGAMAFAYFTVHQPNALFPIQNGGEKAVLFCWAFLLVAALGPGPFALDRLVHRTSHRRPAAAAIPTRAADAPGHAEPIP